MFYKKEGLPEESEIVLCTVLNVHHNTVFVLLDEYDKKGVIHISEISPGRIRNIRDFVVEGKKIICKVLRIDESRGHIDLSLRRVTEVQKREKNNQLKQEQKAEKILELACKEAGKELKAVYDGISDIVFEEYPTLFSCFEDVVAETFDLRKLKLDPKLTKALENLIKTRIKPPEVMIEGIMKVESYAPNGVDIVKDAFMTVTADNVSVSYAGAGRFNMIVKAEDYKTAETDLKKAVDSVIEHMQANNGKAEFTRKED